MANLVQANINIRMSPETKEYFDASFEASGANSKGEFIFNLLEHYNNPQKSPAIEKIVEVEKPVNVEKIVEVERVVEVEKGLESNQVLLTLTDSQLFALRETILSFTDFAERQNKIIDSFSPENKTWMDDRDKFSPEFFQMWGRFEPIIEDMTEEERERIIKLNIPSCLLNSFLFLMFIPERSEHINESLVTPRIIREFIIANQEKNNLESTDEFD